MNRRDFQSESLLQAAGQVIAPWLDLPESEPSADVALLRCSRRAMATLFELFLPVETRGGSEIASGGFDLMDELESQLTVYRDDSEVSLLNRRAAEEPVEVEVKLFDLLRTTVRLTAETWGAFDVTAGPLIKAWGFFRRQGRVPTPAERQDALDRVGMRHVELNEERRTVRFRRPGVEINFGSIGKGYALDRAAEQLAQRGVRSALLHAGSSSVRAVGRQPGDERGWPVGIRHPWEEGRRIGIVNLRDRALGTSAATYQHFEYNRRRLGHLLDPRTGRPAEGIASATALAPTAAEADALATAFFILGVDKTRLYCAAHPGIGAVLLPEEAETPVVIGLGSDDFSPGPAGRTTP
jgi:thiamine biosynthesis lipoprotein